MSRTQWLIAISGGIAAANAVRQALFATATISPWLATLSGGVALIGAAAFALLRQRHWAAAPALISFGVAVPLATVLGTEPLLAGALPFSGRAPGYVAAAAVGFLAAWGGLRELARERHAQVGAAASDLLAAPSGINDASIRPRDRAGVPSRQDTA